MNLIKFIIQTQNNIQRFFPFVFYLKKNKNDQHFWLKNISHKKIQHLKIFN